MNKLFKLIALLALTGLTVSCSGYFHGKKEAASTSNAIARGVLEKGKATAATCSIMELPSGDFFSSAIVQDGAYAAHVPAGPFSIDCEITKYINDKTGIEEDATSDPVQLLAVSSASSEKMSLNVNVLTTLVVHNIKDLKSIKDADSLVDAKKTAQDIVETKYGIVIGDIDTLSLKDQGVLAQVSLAVQTELNKGTSFDDTTKNLDKDQVTAQKGKKVNADAIATANPDLVPPELVTAPPHSDEPTIKTLTSNVTIGGEDVTKSPSNIDASKAVAFSLPASLVTNLGDDNTVYISGKSDVAPIDLIAGAEAYTVTDAKSLFEEAGTETTFTVCILPTIGNPEATDNAKCTAVADTLKQTFTATAKVADTHTPAIAFNLAGFHVLLNGATALTPTLVGSHYTFKYAPYEDFSKPQHVSNPVYATCDTMLDPYDKDGKDNCAAGGLVQFFITKNIVDEGEDSVYLTTKVSNHYGADPVPRVEGQTGRNRLVRANWDSDYNDGMLTPKSGTLYYMVNGSKSFIPPLLTVQNIDPKSKTKAPKFIVFRDWQVKAKTATYTFNVCKHTVSLAQDSQVTGIEALLGTKWNDVVSVRKSVEVGASIKPAIAATSDITPEGENCLSGDDDLGSVSVTVNMVDFESLTTDVKIGGEEAIDPREIDTGKAVPFSLPVRLVRKLKTGESVYITSDKEGAHPIVLAKSIRPLYAYTSTDVKALFKDLETPTTFTICIAKAAAQADCLGVDSALKQTFTATATGTDNASIGTGTASTSTTIKIGEEYEDAIEIDTRGAVAFSIPASLVPPLVEDTSIYITSDKSKVALKELDKKTDGSYAIDTIKDLFQAIGKETKFTVCVLHNKVVAKAAGMQIGTDTTLKGQYAGGKDRALLSHENIFEDTDPTAAIPAPSVTGCQDAKVKRVFKAIAGTTSKGTQNVDTDNNANAGITVHHGTGSAESLIRGVLVTLCKDKDDCETPKLLHKP